MDLVGDAIVAMRAGEPRSARARLTGNWGLRFAASGGLGVHVVLRGTAWLLPPGGGDPVLLETGDAVLVSRNRSHGLAADPGNELADVVTGQQVYWQRDEDIPAGVTPTVLIGGAYYLTRTRPHPLIATLPAVIHSPARLGLHPAVRSIVELLGDELAATRPGSTAVIPALLDLLLLYTVRGWYEHADHTSGWAAALRDPGITTALQAMHSGPGTGWTVESLGRQAGMSRAGFARRFSALIGQPPLAYLAWWRMTSAGRLLKDTDLSLAAVAQQVGYTSEFAFSRAFRREFGIAPGRYRRQDEAPARP